MPKTSKGNSRELTRVFIVTLLLLPITAMAADKSAANVEERRKQLDTLLKEQWEYSLKTSPEFATILGDKRYNDKVSDVSEKAVYADLEMTKRFLARFEGVDTTGFPEQEQLNKTLMIRGLKEQLDDAKFENWLAPKPPWTTSKMTAGRLHAMKKAIVGLVMTVEEIDGSFKLNQHKSDVDHLAVAAALGRQGDAAAQLLASEMHALRPELSASATTLLNAMAPPEGTM